MKLKSYIFIKNWLYFLADDIYLLIRNDTTGFVHLIFALKKAYDKIKDTCLAVSWAV